MQNSTYNALDYRVTNTVSGTITVYLYQGTNMIYENAAGTKYDFVYANGILIATTSNSISSYFQEDNLHSVRLETTSSGDIAFSSDYEPYGLAYGTTGSSTSPFEYTSRQLDSQAGAYVYYFIARYYDGSTGRFLSEDSNTGSLSDPMSLNRYIYASDNPVTENDPTGSRPVVPGGGPPIYNPAPTTGSSGSSGGGLSNFCQEYGCGAGPSSSSLSNSGSETECNQNGCTGGNGQNDYTIPTKLDFNQWFDQVFWPEHGVDIGIAVTDALLAVVFLGDGISAAQVQNALSVTGTAQICWDILHPDSASDAVKSLTSYLVGVVEDLWVQASTYEQVIMISSIGAGIGVDVLGGISTAGIADIVNGARAAYAIGSLAYTLTGLAYDMYSGWESYQDS